MKQGETEMLNKKHRRREKRLGVETGPCDVIGSGRSRGNMGRAFFCRTRCFFSPPTPCLMCPRPSGRLSLSTILDTRCRWLIVFQHSPQRGDFTLLVPVAVSRRRVGSSRCPRPTGQIARSRRPDWTRYEQPRHTRPKHWDWARRGRRGTRV